MTAIILAGGQGSRMAGGSPPRTNKAHLRIGGDMIIRNTISRLGKIFPEIIIVTSAAMADGLTINVDIRGDASGVRYIRDVYARKGPLGGIHAGLSLSKAEYSFVVACDMPFVNVSLTQYMVRQAFGYDVVVPYLDGQYEPLHAIYSRACLPYIEAELAGGNLKIQSFFGKVRVRLIEAAEVALYDPRRLSFFNINTRDDLRQAGELASGKWE